MQTFLPYPNFRLSAHVLDAKRLGKQRVENAQLLRMIAGIREGGSYRFHPVTIMWTGYGPALCLYQSCVISEWRQRGYVNNLPDPRTPEGCAEYGIPKEWATEPVQLPEWVGIERLHASHRAALLFKDKPWYSQFCWDEPAMYDYFWPGKLPAPGDYLIAPDQTVHLVREITCGGAALAVSSDGTETVVSRRQIFAREWTRGVSSGL